MTLNFLTHAHQFCGPFWLPRCPQQQLPLYARTPQMGLTVKFTVGSPDNRLVEMPASCLMFFSFYEEPHKLTETRENSGYLWEQKINKPKNIQQFVPCTHSQQLPNLGKCSLRATGGNQIRISHCFRIQTQPVKSVFILQLEPDCKNFRCS